MIGVLVALALSLVLNLTLLRWLSREQQAASSLRAFDEHRRRRFGEVSELAAKVGDISEGTLSYPHARDLAEWILDDYHHVDFCALALGFQWCTCDGDPTTRRTDENRF